MVDQEQSGVSSASAGGASAPDPIGTVRAVDGVLFVLGHNPDYGRRWWPVEGGGQYEDGEQWRQQDRPVVGAVPGTPAARDPRDAEIERLRGELDKANAGWEVWRDEQRARDKRRDNELRVVAERLHELIGETEPCAMAFVSTRHLHGLLDRVVAESSPEIVRLRDQLGEVCTALHNQLSDYDECGVFTREHALYLVRQLGGRVRLRDMTITAMHKQMAGTNAETDRLRAELHRIRDIALVVLNVLPDDDDRSAVDLVREILESAGPEKLRRDNRFRDLVAERDRWKARYNQLIGGALAVQQHLQRAHGQPETAVTSEYMGPDFSRSMVDGLRDGKERAETERDRLRQELGLIGEQQPKFQPGQRVRIGLCDGIVITPKDTTRVQFEGMLHTFDVPTRDVHAIDDIVPAEPRRWVAGDPEPEIGTKVRSWQEGSIMVRRADGWHYEDCGDNCDSPDDLKWTEMLDGTRLVEVVSTDG